MKPKYTWINGYKIYLHTSKEYQFLERSFPDFFLHYTKEQVRNYRLHFLKQGRFGIHAILDKQNQCFAGYLELGMIHWEKPYSQLPEEGSDWITKKIAEDIEQRRTPNTIVGMTAIAAPGYPVIQLLLNKCKEIMYFWGCDRFITALRPMGYKLQKSDDFSEYTFRTSFSGKPIEPWAAFMHESIGTRVIKPCMKSVQRAASIAQWEKWLDKKFTQSGSYEITGGIFPLEVDVENDIARYCEPGIWVAKG